MKLLEVKRKALGIRRKAREEKEEKSEETRREEIREYIEGIVEEILNEKLGGVEENIQEAIRREAEAAANKTLPLVSMQFVRLGDLMTEIMQGTGALIKAIDKGEDISGAIGALERLKNSFSAGVRITAEIASELDKIKDKLEELREAKEWLETAGKSIIELRGELGRVNSELKSMQVNYQDIKEKLKRDLTDHITENVLAAMIKYGIMDSIKNDVSNRVLLEIKGGLKKELKEELLKELGGAEKRAVSSVS